MSLCLSWTAAISCVWCIALNKIHRNEIADAELLLGLLDSEDTARFQMEAYETSNGNIFAQILQQVEFPCL